MRGRKMEEPEVIVITSSEDDDNDDNDDYNLCTSPDGILLDDVKERFARYVDGLDAEKRDLFRLRFEEASPNYLCSAEFDNLLACSDESTDILSALENNASWNGGESSPKRPKQADIIDLLSLSESDDNDDDDNDDDNDDDGKRDDGGGPISHDSQRVDERNDEEAGKTAARLNGDENETKRITASATKTTTTREEASSSSSSSRNMGRRERLMLRQEKRLERQKNRLSRQIQRLEEAEVDLEDMDQETTAYMLEDRLKRQFMKAEKQLCDLRNERMPKRKKKFNYHGSRFEEIDEAVSRWVNRHWPEFPDFQDVRSIVKRTNEKKKLNLDEEAIKDTTRRFFSDLGEKLQAFRQRLFVKNFGCYLTDEYKDDKDPALQDDGLLLRLKRNEEKSKTNLAEVLDLYVKKQEGIGIRQPAGRDPDDAEDDDTDNEEEEEDEEDDEDDDDGSSNTDEAIANT